MQKSLCLLFIILTAAMPVHAQEKPDIPDPECDGGTADLVRCLNDATAKWDKRLNAAYQEAVKDKEAPAEQRAQLRKAQRLWVQYRDANCEYYALSEGTIARVNAASCLLDMTRARAKELEFGAGELTRRHSGRGRKLASPESITPALD